MTLNTETDRRMNSKRNIKQLQTSSVEVSFIFNLYLTEISNESKRNKHPSFVSAPLNKRGPLITLPKVYSAHHAKWKHNDNHSPVCMEGDIPVKIRRMTAERKIKHHQSS